MPVNSDTSGAKVLDKENLVKPSVRKGSPAKPGHDKWLGISPPGFSMRKFANLYGISMNFVFESV